MRQVKQVLENTNGVLSAQQPMAEEPREITIPKLSDLNLSHDTTKTKLLTQAVNAAKEWSKLKRANRGTHASVVLVASDVRGDKDRTGYGIGKTHIARCILWSEYIIVDDKPVAPTGHFVMADDLIKDTKRVMDFIKRKRWESEKHKSDRERVCPVLIVDDVGTEENIEGVAKDDQAKQRHAKYFAVINECYDPLGKNGVSVIVTANMKISELGAHIGGRAWDRLQEMAPAGMILDLSGVPSWRKKVGGR